MLELLAVITFFGYIYYLRNYADLSSKSVNEEAEFSAGILLYRKGAYQQAFDYFNTILAKRPNACIALLYRGLCYQSQGLIAQAELDLRAALSIDDDVWLAHMELGKLQFQNGDLEQALTTADKAVIKAGDTSSEPYLFRAELYRKLGRQKEADADRSRAGQVLKMTRTGGRINSPEPFMDKKLLVSMVLVLFTSALVILVIKNAESVHLPYIVAVVCAIALGFAEPRKGWILAIMQVVVVLSGYFLFTEQPQTTGQIEIENFSLYGSVILTFVASFLGAFMKRALNMS
jgi:tetratricopeptide (TPR) repeat protein